MASTLQKIVYRDLSLSFTPNPITGNVEELTNDRAVKQALKNLILTNFYETHYNAFFGGNLSAQLFENFTSFTEHIIRKQIIIAVQNHEPRVELILVNVSANDDQHIIDVKIKFRVINSTEASELNLILDRVR